MIFCEKIKTFKRTNNPVSDCLKLQKFFLDNNNKWLYIDYDIDMEAIRLIGNKNHNRIKLKKVLASIYNENLNALYTAQKYLLKWGDYDD